MDHGLQLIDLSSISFICVFVTQHPKPPQLKKEAQKVCQLLATLNSVVRTLSWKFQHRMVRKVDHINIPFSLYFSRKSFVNLDHSRKFCPLKCEIIEMGCCLGWVQQSSKQRFLHPLVGKTKLGNKQRVMATKGYEQNRLGLAMKAKQMEKKKGRNLFHT